MLRNDSGIGFGCEDMAWFTWDQVALRLTRIWGHDVVRLEKAHPGNPSQGQQPTGLQGRDSHRQSKPKQGHFRFRSSGIFHER